MFALGNIVDICSAFTPVDFNTSDAATGHRVHMRNYDTLAFVLFKGAGTAGADPVITIQEHNAATSGTSQNLAVIDEFYHKQETSLDGDETWARVTQSLAATASVDTWAENEVLAVVQVQSQSMSAGFEWLSANIAATVANAQLVSGLYILTGLKQMRRPDLLAQPNA